MIPCVQRTYERTPSQLQAAHHALVGTGLDSNLLGSSWGPLGILMSLDVLVLSNRANGGRDAVVAGWPSAVSVPATGATSEPKLPGGTLHVSIEPLVGGAVQQRANQPAQDQIAAHVAIASRSAIASKV